MPVAATTLVTTSGGAGADGIMAALSASASQDSAEAEARERKTRSRKGCYTCRDRHKKCDEAFTHGPTRSCGRCFHGSWACVKPVAPGSKPLKQFARGKSKKVSEKAERAPPTRLVNVTENDQTGETMEEDEEEDDDDDRPYSRGSSEEIAEAAAVLSLTPLSFDGQQHAPPPSSHSITTSNSLPIPSSSTSSSTSHIFSFPSNLHPPPLMLQLPFRHGSPAVFSPSAGEAAHPSPTIPAELGNDLDTFFQSLDAIAGPSSGLGNYWDDEHQATSTMEVATVAGASPAPGGIGGVLDLDNDSTPASQEALPKMASPLEDREDRGPLLASAMVRGQSLPSPAPDPLVSPPARSSHQDGLPSEVAPSYIAWNDGFFRSIPKPVREVVTQRMNNVAATSELTRAASMAMVLLYRSRTSKADDKDETSARLVRQSDAYFQQALQHLQTPIPLEAQLIAVLDMQAYQFDQWGAAAAHAILLLGEYFVTEAFSVPQPALNLSDLRDSSAMALRAFAYTDVLHTVCIPRRRTLFAFANQPGDPTTIAPSTPTHSDETDRAVETHLGLPVGLLLCFAATSNLSAEMASFPDQVVVAKAQAIEKAIREWRPLPPDAAALADSTVYLDELSTAEMWRHTALLYLYQTVHRHGSLSLTIRTCLNQILQIGARVMNAPVSLHNADNYVSACATRSAPWFLAGTVALSHHDRELVRKGLSSCGPQRGYQDNLAAIERIWHVTDEKGWNRNWQEILAEEKMFVGFL